MMTSNHPRRYRHKPIFVEAIIFNGGAESASAVKEWAGKHGGTVTHHPGTQGTGSIAMPSRPERIRIGRTAQGVKSGILHVEPGEVVYFANDRFVKAAGHEFAAEWDLDEQETLLGGDAPVSDQATHPALENTEQGTELQPEPAVPDGEPVLPPVPDNATTPMTDGGFATLSADDLTGGDEEDGEDEDPILDDPRYDPDLDDPGDDD